MNSGIKIRITDIIHEGPLVYGICEVLSGRPTWEEKYDIINNDGKFVYRLYMSKVLTEPISPSLSGNERRRMLMGEHGIEEYEKTLRDDPDEMRVGFLLVYDLPDEKVKTQETDETPPSDESAETDNFSDDTGNDDVMSVDDMTEILKKGAERAREEEEAKKKSSSGISSMDLIEFYNSLKKGTISSEEKTNFLRSLADDVYGYLNKKIWKGLWLVDDIQKAILILRLDDNKEFYQLMLGSMKVSEDVLGLAFCDILAKHHKIRRTLDSSFDKDPDPDKILMGDIRQRIRAYKKLFSSCGKKTDIYEAEEKAKRGGIAAALAAFFISPLGKALFSLPVMSYLFEPIMFVAAIEAAIRGKVKGCLTYMLSLFGILFFVSAKPQTQPQTLFAAFYAIRAAILLYGSVPDIIRSKSNKYADFNQNRRSYYYALESFSEAVRVIRTITDSIDFETGKYATDAYYELCISEIEKLKNFVR